MNRTFKLEQVLSEMNCYSVMAVDFKDRCQLARTVKHCSQATIFFNYFSIMYCNMGIQSKLQELSVIAAFGVLALFLMLMIAHVVQKYFGPILKIMSFKLKMNQYFAGVTLLSLGNSLPEFLTNLMPIRDRAPLFAIPISNAIAVILVSGGVLCYLRPFKINAHCALRDLLFLVLGGEILAYMVTSHDVLSSVEAAGLVLMYITYLVVNVVDLKLMRRKIRVLKKQIKAISKKPSTPTLRRLLKEKTITLHEMEMDNMLVVIDTTTESSTSNDKYDWQATEHVYHAKSLRDFSKKKPDNEAPQQRHKITRDILHNPTNPPNLFLYVEFLETLKPIDVTDWQQERWCGRIYMIFIAPIALICNFFIPVVDYTQDKHGWSKLHNCIQVVICPFTITLLTHSMIDKKYSDSRLTFHSDYAIWTFCLSVPLALFILFKSRTDRPPIYHKAFMILTFSSSILLLTICTAELDVLCSIIGLVLHLTEDFTSSNIRSFSSAISESVFNINFAIKGYERMVFAGVMAGPLFAITGGTGLTYLCTLKSRNYSNPDWLFGVLGDNCYVFFMLAIVSTLAWAFTFNFYARRSAGIFSVLLYFIFTLYSALVEWDIIHEFKRDRFFDPR